MPIHRIIPTLALAALVPLFAWAQTPSPSPTTATPPEPPPTEAEKALDEAITKVKALQSIAADISQDGEMLGQEFRVTGRYLKAPGYRVSLLLRLEGPDGAKGQMLQVSDGTTLHDFSMILGNTSVRRLQLTPILKALESPDADAELRERVLGGLGFAGPEALLVGLRQAIRFDGREEGTLDGRPVLILRGQWKDYESLNGPGQPKFEPFAPLPPFVPSVATLYLGRADGWPYKLVLEGLALNAMQRKKDDRLTDPNGRPIGRKAAPSEERRSRIVLLYSNVQIEPSLQPADFAFTPGSNLEVRDDTERIVADLTAFINESAARKRSEAAKGAGGGELLPSIPVTPPPADGKAAPDTFRSTAPPPPAD